MPGFRVWAFPARVGRFAVIRSRRWLPLASVCLALLFCLSAASADVLQHADLRCEGDGQWMDIKRRLYFLLRQVEHGRLDPSRAVNQLAAGVSPEDLDRCWLGAATVQLFMQLALVAMDPGAMLSELSAGPRPDQPHEAWLDLPSLHWEAIFASQWPVFETMTRVREAIAGLNALEVNPGSPCADLWHDLTPELRLALEVASSEQAAGSAGVVARLALDLPADACEASRSAALLGLLAAMRTGEWPMAGPPEAERQLLAQAQMEAGSSWPTNFLRSPWPVLPLLASVERRAVPSAARRALIGELRGAIAFIHFFPESELRLEDIERSLASIQTYWLDVVGKSWPVVIFADEGSAATQRASLQGRFPRMDLRVTAIDERDLLWPMPHEHPRCSTGYRRAARITAGPLWMHAALDFATHVMLVDTEFELTHPVPWDPLQHLFDERGQLAYWQMHYERMWNRTLFLTEISREFMTSRGLTPQIPELVQYWWDHEEIPGGSFPVNLYGCLFAGSMDFFRSELYQSYFRELDTWTGWSEFCWSPQSVLAIAASFFLAGGELTELWVFGRHQNSTKTPEEGWNRSWKGILPPDTPLDKKATTPPEAHKHQL